MPQLPAERIDEPASFETLTGEKLNVPVHFNPASLQYTVANTLKEEGKGAKKKQYVSQTTAKLTMDLVFDTTDTGEDVRVTTNKMAKLLQPVAAGGGKNVPPTVRFSWGAYAFTGMVEQYKETIDFFAAGGVPLRASINLTLSSQDVVFDSGTASPASVDADLGAEPVVTPGADDGAGPGGAQGVANAAGDPRAARAIAAANGAASLRFGAGASLAVGASVGVGFGAGAAVSAGFSAGIGASAGAGFSASAGAGMSASAGLSASADANLLPPAAFASGGGGLSLGAGAGLGVSAGGGLSLGAGGGAGIGASLSASAGAGAGFGVGAGGGASAGFAGLRLETTQSTRSLNTAALLPGPASASFGASAGGVAAGGRLTAGSGGLRAEVGADADFVIGGR